MSKSESITVALLSLVLIGLFYVGYQFLLAFEIDPFDRFEVVSVESNSGEQQHAVVYRYHHANSSADTTAVWIVSGARPGIGSTLPVKGSPILVWFGQPQDLKLNWQANNGRLSAVVDRADTIKSDGQVENCFFDYDAENLVCFDPKRIDFTPK
jgi:hypothetical protein